MVRRTTLFQVMGCTPQRVISPETRFHSTLAFGFGRSARRCTQLISESMRTSGGLKGVVNGAPQETCLRRKLLVKWVRV